MELSLHAERPALIASDKVYTYRELDCAIEGLCLELQKRGVKAGDRVAFIPRIDAPTIALFFALFRLGAAACPLSHRLPSEQISSHLARLNTRWFIDPSSLSWDPRPPAERPVSLEASATFLFTSGSTGIPKIACHSLGNHYYSALGAIEGLKLTSSSRWRLSLPLYHVGGIGIIFRCFLAGAAIVLDESVTPTHVSLVPTQLYRQKRELGDVQCILLGGAPIPASLLEETRDLPVMTSYGMTETSSLVALSGRVLPFRELMIGEGNEIFVKGRVLFQGYWENGEVKKVEGWFPTKDLGRWNEGKLEIIGRKDRQFISGGENIQPEEIEQALLQIPGILQAVIVPITDPEFGMRPAAFVDGAEHDVESIREALKLVLPAFKHPVKVFPMPENAGLKPNLRDLLNRIPK